MFSVRCDTLDREVLLGNRDILAIRNMDDGILVAYRCFCGEKGVLLTGSGAAEERSGHVEVPLSA